MIVPRLGIRTRLRRLTGSVADTRFRLPLRRLAEGKPDDYRRYLDVQLQRTLSKRDNDPGSGARVLAGKVVELGRLSAASSVLCVGCRNPIEIDLFAAAGVGEVVGIDLLSQRPDILVMDMHAMSFEDSRFHAVYASHALEHSYDTSRVVAELARVGRAGAIVGVEVPLGSRASAADRVEFHSLDDLLSIVAPIVGEELWTDVQPAGTPTNDQGTPVARVVFSLG